MAARQAPRPLLKVALLVGVTEYASDSGYATLASTAKDLETMQYLLGEQSGFTCYLVESNLSSKFTG